MYYIKRDPGCCPVDGSPHTTCCAPSSGGAIVAGPIQTPTSITVSAPEQQNGTASADPGVDGDARAAGSDVHDEALSRSRETRTVIAISRRVGSGQFSVKP
jgi:hypothetical protein